MDLTGPVVSYAQNAEDIVLLRALGHPKSGFYVDVGAGHPVNESVTKVFYDRGWRGVNIDPCHSTFSELQRKRPRDVNLNVGLGSEHGEMVFYEAVDQPGSSTFAPELAAMLRDEGVEIAERRVEIRTLSAIYEEFVQSRIDFLKIDVEGFEAEVIAGGDWKTWRPRILVIEATKPRTTTPTHDAWEPILLSNGYRFSLFDGVNRFYFHEEDSEIGDLLRIPANVLDDFVPYWHVAAIDALHATEGEFEEEKRKAEKHVVALELQIGRLKEQAASHRVSYEAAAAENKTAHEHIGHLNREVKTLKDELSQLSQHIGHQEDELDARARKLVEAADYSRRLEEEGEFDEEKRKAEKHIVSLELQIGKLKEQAARHQVSYEAAAAENKTAHEHIGHLNREVKTLKDELSQLSQHVRHQEGELDARAHQLVEAANYARRLEQARADTESDTGLEESEGGSGSDNSENRAPIEED